MVSYCDRWMSNGRRVSSVVNNFFKGHLLLNYWLDLTKLGRNDPNMILFINCSNGSGPLHIKVTQDFQDENFKRSSSLKPQGLEFCAGPRSAVGNVSGYRCMSDCRSWGREFDPGPVPYFRGD